MGLDPGALRGLAEDLNHFADDSNISARPASVGLATTYCVLYICLMVPCVNALALLPMPFVYLLMLNSFKNSAADIAAARQAA
jgi:hypothetical protein